jgi:hypothetical protein
MKVGKLMGSYCEMVKMKMIRVMAAGALSLAATSVANAQGSCETIKSEEDRLKCYDAAAETRKSTTATPKDDPVLLKAKATILRILKDPASARFEGIVKRPAAICGFVNAKNSMGGYTGRTMFVYLIKENRGYVLEVNTVGVQDAIAAAEKHCTGVPGF